MATEALRGGGTGRGEEERRHGMVTEGAQAGTGDPLVINNPPMAS